MDISYIFVNYGERFDPMPGTIVLDVGMKTVPGVIDHHHPEAEAECAASLVVKYPALVLGHIRPADSAGPAASAAALTFITHRLPDFDALASLFLAARLLETGRVDPAMERLAAYAKLVDSAALPGSLDLAATPYAVLRALFSGSKKSEDEINRERIDEGLKFMRFLHARAEAGDEIVENRRLFIGIDRYERAIHKVEGDYSNYLADLDRGRLLRLKLPMTGRPSPAGAGVRVNAPATADVDGLAISNPSSFLAKEWARRDRLHSPDGRGFGLLMTKFGENRFILGVDPSRGIHLKGLGSLLNAKEKEKRISIGRSAGPPWYEGDNAFFDYRIVDSPQDGTSLTMEDVLQAVQAFGNGRRVEPH